ncbi:19572_t:CDS:2, partial [Dentiscutata erythropus]
MVMGPERRSYLQTHQECPKNVKGVPKDCSVKPRRKRPTAAEVLDTYYVPEKPFKNSDLDSEEEKNDETSGKFDPGGLYDRSERSLGKICENWKKKVIEFLKQIEVIQEFVKLYVGQKREFPNV